MLKKKRKKKNSGQAMLTSANSSTCYKPTRDILQATQKTCGLLGWTLDKEANFQWQTHLGWMTPALLRWKRFVDDEHTSEVLIDWGLVIMAMSMCKGVSGVSPPTCSGWRSSEISGEPADLSTPAQHRVTAKCQHLSIINRPQQSP